MSEPSPRTRGGGRPSPARRGGRLRLVSVALALVLAVAAIYGQTWHHDFVDYDDDTYILNNPEVTGGLSALGLRWAFGFHAGNWHPLTWISHMLDCSLFGLWAGGHHLANAGLHAANAVLLCAILVAMTGAFWRSAAVAALFALHPLRVESVAWAAERKDVLSAFFWLLTLGAYLRYARRPGAGRYLAVLALFALGLTAKPMLVTLPFVLLLLDGWPLGRALRPRAGRMAPAGGRAWIPLLLEKVPFLLLSIAASLVTLRAQTQNILPIVTPEPATRLANALVSYLWYLKAFFWPEGLAFLYPYPRAGVPGGSAAAAAAVLLFISARALLDVRRRPYLLFGWLWYLGTLVPVIGLIQVGGQSRSDRYTYLTMIGIAVALVWLAGETRRRTAGMLRAIGGLFAIALLALAVTSAGQVRVWRDSLSLFQHTVRVTRDNFLVLNNLGTTLLELQRGEEAIGVLREAARIHPEHCNAHYNLGNALIQRVRYAEALLALERALQCYEREGRVGAYIADTHYTLGIAQLRLGRYPEAELRFRMVLAMAPAYPGARLGLGEALVRQGKASAGAAGR